MKLSATLMRVSALMFVLFFSMLLSVRAAAYNFSVADKNENTIYYNITTATTSEDILGEVEVTYKSSSYNSYSGDVVIPATVTNSATGYTYSVTAIGKYAFYNSTSLSSVSIPEGVTYIAYRAFYGCSALTEVTIPASVETTGAETFRSCSKLATVTIAETSNLKFIAERMFNSCSKLATINIPSSVTSIRDYAFSSCALTSIDLPTSIDSIGIQTFYRNKFTTLKVPEGVTYMGRSACSNITTMTELELPASLDSVSSNVFYSCTKLETVTFNKGCKLRTIGVDMFYSCTSLKSIEIPASVQIIGNEAFYGCSALESVTFEEGSNLSEIGARGFRSCKALTSIVIPEGLTALGQYAFGNCSALTSAVIKSEKLTTIDSHVFTDCTSLRSFNIPLSVTSIGENAFYNCTSLTSIYVPNLVTEIANYAFNGCTSLTSAIIGNSVETLGERVFYGCSSLESLQLGCSLESVDEYSFHECPNITTVISLNTTPPDLDSYIPNYENGLLYVPTGTKDTYANASFFGLYEVESASEVRHNLVEGYPVTMNKFGTATFSNTTCQLLDFSDVEGLTAYYISGCTEDGGTTYATAKEFSGYLGYKQGLLLIGDANTTYVIPNATSDDNAVELTPTDGNCLYATPGSTLYAADGRYVYAYKNNNEPRFYTISEEGATVPVGKAYLQLSDGSGDTKSMSVIFDDNTDNGGTTGIIEVAPATDAQDGVYYNLTGMRVNTPTKGIYIVNGKKVIIK